MEALVSTVRQQAMLCVVALRCLGPRGQSVRVGGHSKAWGPEFWAVGAGPMTATSPPSLLG